MRLAGLEWTVLDFSTLSRRQWRKPHLGIDAQTLEIRAMEVTDNRTGDATMLPGLLPQIPEAEELATVTGDGAYDTRSCHATIADCSYHPPASKRPILASEFPGQSGSQ